MSARTIKHQTKSIRCIYEEFLRNPKSCNITPEYQREFCWNWKKQNLFIDSIMCNYIIPPIVLLHKNRTRDEDYKFECVDGQHRLKIIKHFIEGSPIPKEDCENNHIIFWKSNSTDNMKVFYLDTDFSRKKNCRSMNVSEIDIFNEFEIPIIILRIEGSEKENSLFLKDVFLRLQKGESVKAFEKIKNSNLECIKALNERNLFKSKTYIVNESIYHHLESIFTIKIKKSRNKKWRLSYFPSRIIKSLLIIKLQSLIIGSYMDGNINMGLEGEREGSNKRLNDLTMDECRIGLNILEEFIIDLFKYSVLQIHEYLFHILLFLYITNKPKFTLYIIEPNKDKIIEKCNDLKTYNSFKKPDTSIVKKLLDGYDLEKLIGYIDVDIGCNDRTPLTEYKTRHRLPQLTAQSENSEESSDDDDLIDMDSDED